MDVEALLAPVSEEAPAGDDLSYDHERQVIENAFETGVAEDGEPVDWRETVRLIEAQSARTKDVWLAVYLTRAGARMGKLDTVVAGAQMLAGLFERYWPEVHPTLDEYGFQGRKGPCESLTRIGEFLGPLKRTVLIEHGRLGRFTGEDLERFAVEGDSAEGYGMFRAALDDTPVETIVAAIDAVDAIRDGIRRADAVMVANADGDTGTNFQPTYEVIEGIRKGLMPYAGIEVEAAATADDSATTGAPSGGGPRVAGRIDTREDVIKALDAISEYYRVREPGSPIPVALRRVRGWVTMDFMAIMEELVPTGISEVRTVLLSRSEQSDAASY